MKTTPLTAGKMYHSAWFIGAVIGTSGFLEQHESFCWMMMVWIIRLGGTYFATWCIYKNCRNVNYYQKIMLTASIFCFTVTALML